MRLWRFPTRQNHNPAVSRPANKTGAGKIMLPPPAGGEAGRELHFTYILSRRRSYQISIRRDGGVLLRAPLHFSYEELQDIVRYKARWIRNKLEFYAQAGPPPAPDYTQGSAHFFLGREYRLELSRGGRARVQLSQDLIGGALQLAAAKFDAPYLERVLQKWYLQQASRVYQELLAECWPLFGNWDYPMPPIRIRKMKSRWGSMSAQGQMTLNLELIKYRPAIISYVIIHELCHLKHMNHGKNFYRALSSRLPNWKALKQELEETKLRIQ